MAQISTVKCSVCTVNDSSIFCYECKTALCKTCQTVHDKLPISEKHKFTDISKVDRLVYKTENQCICHKEQFISFCTRCKCMICHVCLSTSHNGHNFIGIDAASQKARRDLNRSVAKGKGALRQLEKIISDIESGFLVNLKEVRNKEIEKIQTTKKVVEGLLDIVTETTTNDIDSFIHVEKHKLMMTLRKAEMLRKEYETVISALDKLSEITHDTTYLCFYLKQKDDLLKLDDIPVCDKPATLDEFQAIDFFREVVAKINERFECNVLEKEKEQNHDQIITKLNAEIKELKEENQRLSEVAGIKLTEGNSSIANLGDPNRQMKVGEMYSELYDNDWTDLMDKLEAEKQKPDVEDKILQALCATLETCYNHCEMLDKKLKEYEEQISELLNFDKMTANQIKSYRRNTLEKLESHIEVVRTDSKFQKELEKEFGLKKDALQIVLSSPFFEKCFRICWLMVVLHQPPMVIEMAGKDINNDKFREYTKSGKKVVFTVWPALLLHQDGPVVVKGVTKMK